MNDTPDRAMKDKNYNLVSILEASLKNAWTLEDYIRDADADGDAELADWFRRIQHNSLKAGEQGKRMLGDRLAEQGEGRG